MEKYLQNPNLPEYLKPVSATTLYANVNLTDSDKYKEKDFKYHQYFSNLSSNYNIYSTDDLFYPNDSFPYYKTHNIYRPVSKSNTDVNKNINKQSFQKFDSFTDIPTLFSDVPLSGMSYYTAIDMPDGIYFYGGLHAMLTSEYVAMLSQITKNFTIPPENIKMICDYDLPLPLDKEKIESMSLKPKRSLFKFLTDSKSIKCYGNFADDDELGDEVQDNVSSAVSSIAMDNKAYSQNISQTSNINSTSSTSNWQNRCPPPLICSGGAKMSDRFFMMYGGLYIKTRITYPDELHCTIEKELIPNDQFWLFDTVTHKFRQIKISTHPTYSSIFPNSIARFGHRVTSVTMEENMKVKNKSAKSSSGLYINNPSNPNMAKSFAAPAIMFVMGGYQLSESGKSFIAMNDLWKCDVFLDSHGTADEAIASPIGNFNLVNDSYSYIIDENMNQLMNKSDTPKFTGVFNHTSSSTNWPCPRGFFTMDLIERETVATHFNWNTSNETLFENEEIEIQNPIPQKATFNSSLYSLNKLSSERIKPTKSPLLSIYSRSHSSSSLSTEVDASPSSPYSGNALHTSGVESLKSKVLVVYGGSSIMYTKVVDDLQFDVFYTKSVQGDIWIFDFQTELWYNLQDYVSIPDTISLCGHSMVFSSGSLHVFGGIEREHYYADTYLPAHAGKSESLYDSENRIQNVLWERGRECVFKFHENLAKSRSEIQISLMASKRGIELASNEQYYNSYSSYIFNLTKAYWRLVDIAIITNLEYFAPWKYNSESRVLCGSVITNNDCIQNKEDESIDLTKEINCREKLIDETLIVTNSPIFLKDNRLIMLSPDIKVMDMKTRKCPKNQPALVGNCIAEIFSTHL